MSNLNFCPDDDNLLVRLYVNANQAIKYKIHWQTNLFICVKCNELFEAQPKKIKKIRKLK